MFGKKRAPTPPPPSPPPAPASRDLALDTLAGLLRAMAEFALEQEGTDIATFRQQAEAWALHVAVAAPPPTGKEHGAAQGGRRDWEGVRQFVREYCRSSTEHANGVAADLRQVVWAFIRNFSQAFTQDEQTDERIQLQISRLETLVEASPVSDLKREVLDTVGVLGQALEERRQRQRAQLANLGETVRALGDELESTRREGEIDPLTRVHNRKAFDLYVQSTLEVAAAFRQSACLMVVDVDHFKTINDTFGHAVGDQALREVADAIVKVFLRKSDFVARYGGDEFAVILRETTMADALPLAERVAARVRAARIRAGDRQVVLTLSIGVAPLAPGDDAGRWFERADRGLYLAKSEGRDRVAVGPGTPPSGSAPVEAVGRGEPSPAPPVTDGKPAG